MFVSVIFLIVEGSRVHALKSSSCRAQKGTGRSFKIPCFPKYSFKVSAKSNWRNGYFLWWKIIMHWKEGCEVGERNIPGFCNVINRCSEDPSTLDEHMALGTQKESMQDEVPRNTECHTFVHVRLVFSSPVHSYTVSLGCLLHKATKLYGSRKQSDLKQKCCCPINSTLSLAPAILAGDIAGV